VGARDGHPVRAARAALGEALRRSEAAVLTRLLVDADELLRGEL
jgi:hypothetical protein